MSRKTEQRRAIKRVFESATRPLTPQEVLAEAQAELVGLGIATVYRNLKFFFENGYLSKVELANEPARYERSGLEHHHHFFCRSCDRVYDLPGCAGHLEHLVPDNFSVIDHDVTLFGVCSACEQVS